MLSKGRVRMVTQVFVHSTVLLRVVVSKVRCVFLWPVSSPSARAC